MKKPPASVPETQKSGTAKAGRTSKPDASPAAKPASSSATDKPRPASRPPFLNAAVDSVKKMLNLKSAKNKSAAGPKAEAVPPARRGHARNKPEAALDVPPILLEGDEPPAPPATGPGEKFSLGAKPPAQKFSGGELPESYGTKKLFLTARDPHWLYAHWDLTHEQQKQFNHESTDGHLILRVFPGKIEGHPVSEIHVHPESRHSLYHLRDVGVSRSDAWAAATNTPWTERMRPRLRDLLVLRMNRYERKV